MAGFRLSRRPKVFYGYWVMAVTFICLFITAGFGMFGFSLFVKPLQAGLGWGRGEIMVGFTIFFMMVGLSSPFVGWVIDRYPAGRVIAIGALVAGLGFVLLSQTSYLWYFYLCYAVIGIGYTTMGHVSVTAVISNWFKKKRGTAIGIVSTGIGAGGLVMAPVIGSFLIPSFGWGSAYLTMGVLIWVLIIPLALLVIRRAPADRGLYPDGESAPAVTEVTGGSYLTARGLTLRMAVATAAFWLIAISYMVGSFSQVGALQSLAPYLQDTGFPAAFAAGALGSVGLGSLVGKFFFGWLCDRIQPKHACAISLGIQAGSIALLRSIDSTSPLPLVWTSVLLLGFAAGSWLPTMSMLISTNFGLFAYGSIYGVINFVRSLGISTGPLLAGSMFDATGDYNWSFIIFIALCAISILLILAVRRPELFQNEVAR